MSSPTMIDPRPLAAAGLPLGPLTVPLVMYRTTSGRANHVDARCDALSSHTHLFNTIRRTVDLTAGPIQVCNRCSSLPKEVTDAIEWSKRGGKIAAAATGLAALEHDVASPQRSVTLQQLLTICRNDRGTDALGDHARKVAADITRALHADVIGAEVYQTLAALILATKEPSSLSTTTLAHTRELTPMLVESFAFLAVRVIAGATIPQAATEAVAFLAERLPQTPTLLAHIPAVTRFTGATFASPIDWANAEWAAQRAGDLNDIADHWTSAVEMLAGELASSSTEVGYGYTGAATTLTALAVATFPTVQIPSEGSWLMVAPRALLEVCAMATVAPAPSDQTRSVLAMAAVLFDDFYDVTLDDADADVSADGNDELIRASKAIEAAVVLHR